MANFPLQDGSKLMSDNRIRDAASVVLIRDWASDPKVLVGQRGRMAVFMPSKFVFPGGAVDSEDEDMALAGRPCQTCLERMEKHADPKLVDPLLLCAIREVWEEAGIRLARKRGEEAEASCLAPKWRSFVDHHWAPSAEGLAYFFRAITPPGRSRRFDARFFLGDIDRLPVIGDPEDFGKASDELRNLQWIALSDAPNLDLPSISRLVLKSAKQLLAGGYPPSAVPFHYSEGGKRQVIYL